MSRRDSEVVTAYPSDSEAYSDAWSKLNQRYGQPFIIQRAFRENLSNWPKIQSKDAEGVRDFSDYLNACLQAMPHVKGLTILDDCEENQKLIRKLPEWIASRWNRQVTVCLTEGKDFPSFSEFAKFMSMEAETACNPVTSFFALHSAESCQDKRSIIVNRGNKVSAFNTQTVVENNSQTTPKERVKAPCMLCQDISHQLCKCPDFMKRKLEYRRTYIKENRLCYGRLKPHHGVKECRHRHTCDSCKGQHSTCLHDNSYGEGAKRENSAQHSETAPTPALSLKVTSQGQSENSSMIVPVWVSSHKHPSSEKLVYALVDTQSDETYIEQDLCNELQLTTAVKLELTTMMGENILKSEKTSGLRVRGFNSTVHTDLPPVYTKDGIPVNRQHIPTHEKAKGWHHLRTIADQIQPLLSCEVGLLIGYDCPGSFIPRRVIAGTNEEPFAILTDLGWSIVGGSAPRTDSLLSSSHCHRVSVKELPEVTPMDAIRILETDFRDTQGNDKTVSQEARLKENIKTNKHGHCDMPLPCKERPCLPDKDSRIQGFYFFTHKTSVNDIQHATIVVKWYTLGTEIPTIVVLMRYHKARLLWRARKVKSCDLSTTDEKQSAERLSIKDIQSQAYGEGVKLLSKEHQLPSRITSTFSWMQRVYSRWEVGSATHLSRAHSNIQQSFLRDITYERDKRDGVRCNTDR